MDLHALAGCVSSTGCLITQTTSGLITGLILFLVAAGLTLIFGVLKVVNFAHGAFYMIGAYLALSVFWVTGSYALAVLGAALGMAIGGILFERFLISRVYGSNVLMQLLICYAVVLICDDLVKLIWGPDFQAMGIPPAFQVPPLFIAGGIVPPIYLVLIGAALVIAVVLGVTLARSRLGKIVRAAAENPTMVSALGVNTTVLFAVVFAIGGALAGLAGGLAAPVRSLAPGMGFSVLIDSFIVTVIGGMGSIGGALLSAIILGLVRSFGTIGFPMLTDELVYGIMAIILIVRPTGLFGREVA